MLATGRPGESKVLIIIPLKSRQLFLRREAIAITAPGRKAQLRGRELHRHSSFIEDGRKLFFTLLDCPGVNRVKSGPLTRRGSRVRRIVVADAGTHLLLTLGSNNGHQEFVVYGDPGLLERISKFLTEKFPKHSVFTRETHEE